MRIVIAMSGGVDSSVAAALLAEAGHEVIGLSMQLYDQREGEVRFGTCCTIDDLHDARRVATALQIPHYILNFERQFGEEVVSTFVREYVAGRTPIPCIRCNNDVKFATLLDRARGFDADVVATGHYARVEFDAATNRYLLLRGTDRTRDQAYFLFGLDQTQLAAARFPIGDMLKADVRAAARDRRLPVAEKPESREICFVPDGDYASFVERHADAVPAGGLITDATGRVLGRHDGVHRFTVGQRKGLGLSSTQPLYVLELKPEAQTIVVGARKELERDSLVASGVNWIAYATPPATARVTAQIRYRHQEAAAIIQPLEEGRARVVFDEPQTAVAPGQAAVFYDGDAVIGGGWIE